MHPARSTARVLAALRPVRPPSARRVRRSLRASGLPPAEQLRVRTFATGRAALGWADRYEGEVFLRGRTLLAFGAAASVPPQLRSAYERELRRVAA